MLDDDAPRFRKRLSEVGLSEAVINAAWPDWWSEEAESSSSARAELRYSLARKLGLDPQSLLEDDDSPQFIWKEAARFKHLSGETEFEKSALTSFGRAFAKALLHARRSSEVFERMTALELRKTILRRQPYVRFVDLIALCWSLGIPTAHLRVFPLPQKRMAAMSVQVSDGAAILLGRDANYPPQISFFLAHELAHIFLGHLKENEVLVDLEREEDGEEKDVEEKEADAFALELLTGDPEPRVISTMPNAGAGSLARAVLEAAPDVRIEPGTLALCFGFSTGEWPTAYGALPYIYETSKPVWKEVNRIAFDQLSLDALPQDLSLYVQRVLGGIA